VRKPSRVMIIRELQQEIWRLVEPQIDSHEFTTDSDREIVRLEIQRFVEDKAKSLAIEELADALYSPQQTMALFLEHLHNQGIAGNPLASD
jgi:predicted transcriptional regulator